MIEGTSLVVSLCGAQPRGAGGDPGRLEALRDGVAVGGAAFVGSVEELTQKAGIGRETNRKCQLRARLSIVDITAAISTDRKEPWEKILCRHGDSGVRQLGSALVNHRT